jgi:hypothetical protein
MRGGVVHERSIQEGGTAGADRSLSFACEVLDTASFGGFIGQCVSPSS